MDVQEFAGEPKFLRIRGARMHNLKNIDVDLPRNRLVVFTGLSGSGKSTLAFDTLYAEGQRRYVESLSTYARQFLGQMDKPDCDSLEGLSPAVSIEQKTTSKNPRSTVGTVTEIYDYLRLLYARCGRPHCPECGEPIAAQSVEDMVNTLLALPEGKKIMLLAPLVAARKGRHEQIIERIRREGFARARLDGHVFSAEEIPELDKNKKHTIEVVVDRLTVKASLRHRFSESVATAVKLTGGLLLAFFPDDNEERIFSEHAACHRCGLSVPKLTPQLFSFNNPVGACPDCGGLGINPFFDQELLIPNPEKSLAQGAIAPWNWRGAQSYTGRILAGLSRHYSFSLETPFQDLSSEHQRVILYGTGQERIKFSWQNGEKKGASEQAFEGLIPQLSRRFKETQSPLVREELGRYMNERTCATCGGARLKPEVLAVKVGGWSIHQMTCQSISALLLTVPEFPFTSQEQMIAAPIIKEISDRLRFLENVGLGYLSLERTASTLSGGEAQRIRLASQIGSRLAGVLYILDEPSIGLHQRDNEKLIKTLIDLRDLGNSLIVVEHDHDTILAADHVLDMGPGAGVHGGQVIYSGPVAGLLAAEPSLTGAYLAGRKTITVAGRRQTPEPGEKNSLRLSGARANNLKNIAIDFPLGTLTCVTGVSGSGKSSLVIETLYPLARAGLRQRRGALELAGARLEGIDHIDKLIDIDQSPIGRTPRSNPATYTGVFTPIRELFAQLPESRARGYTASRFSFNVKGGRCEACEGDGVIRIAMHFLPDIYVQCETCHGRRYNLETLDILYNGASIHDVLQMTVEEALAFFKNIPPVRNRLQTLCDVGLGYIRLGQSSTTLSGGEAQRIKLAKELAGRASGKTLYILDEPTTGLHPADIQLLLDVLDRLVAQGNTVVVIEHNLDVIKSADWLIDIGPEGGDGGGQVIACGPPTRVAKVAASHTGRFLAPLLVGK
ncbi:MAG: excinuclease ABC subunit UvrA [Desulfobulbaceae bacterium]|jgi:excinuclease ABC subunit A|nr:excinuclease ABC subunit UvrA [Desulfobulbaceae bacterium]